MNRRAARRRCGFIVGRAAIELVSRSPPATRRKCVAAVALRLIRLFGDASFPDDEAGAPMFKPLVYLIPRNSKRRLAHIWDGCRTLCGVKPRMFEFHVGELDHEICSACLVRQRRQAETDQPREADYLIDELDGGFIVRRGGNVVAGPFASNAEAWSWIDRNTLDGRDDTDRYNRIRDAFSER
jgi:hypothetical protein